MSSPAASTQYPPLIHSRRTILAAVTGNFVEWYEFAIYGVVAASISLTFFPSNNPGIALLTTWAIYGTAFAVRPIGGVILARVGDLYGRRVILWISITLMSVATAAIGLLPSYKTVGFAAPVLLISVRMVQGLAAGGELAGAVAFLYEHSPVNHRARPISWLVAGTFVATLFGSGLATTLTLSLKPDAFESWGWRVLFLLALPLGAIGLYIRSRVAETPVFKMLKDSKEPKQSSPFLTTVRHHLKAVLTFFGFGVLYSTSSYIIAAAYLSYITAAGMKSSQALIANTILSAAVIVVVVVTGGLADRFTRKSVLTAGAVGLMVVVVPVFLLAGTGKLPLVILGAVLLAIPFAVFATPSYMSIVEMFPADVRVTAGALSYNSAVVLGGFSPFISVWMAQTFHTDLAFPFYVAALGAVALIVIRVLYREPKFMVAADADPALSTAGHRPAPEIQD